MKDKFIDILAQENTNNNFALNKQVKYSEAVLKGIQSHFIVLKEKKTKETLHELYLRNIQPALMKSGKPINRRY